MSQTDENAFETHVVQILTTTGGWEAGDRAEWE